MVALDRVSGVRRHGVSELDRRLDVMADKLCTPQWTRHRVKRWHSY